jgi:hypothetical protein
VDEDLSGPALEQVHQPGTMAYSGDQEEQMNGFHVAGGRSLKKVDEHEPM